MRFAPTLFALSLIAPALSAQQITGRRDKTFSFSERIAQNSTVRVFTPSGQIRVTEGSGSTLEFRGEKDLRRAVAEDIGFIVLRQRDGITICAVFDEDDECSDSGINSRRRGWRRNGRQHAQVNVDLIVPRGVALRIASGNGAVEVAAPASEATVSSGNGRVRVSQVTGRVKASSGNGDVTVRGVGGPVDASSGNGDIDVATGEGPVSVSTGNGDVMVNMQKLSRDGDLEFTSGNGRVEVTLPADVDADVEAFTGNGTVLTDFPLTVEGRLQKSRLRGTIGRGGRRLRMTSGSGSLEIRKAN